MSDVDLSLTNQTNKDIVRFISNVLLDIKKELNMSTNTDTESSRRTMKINDSEINRIINTIKNPLNSDHAKRLTHLILYLNTELKNCNWIKTDTSLNLKQYILHGKPIPIAIYFKILEVMCLKPFITEVIMSTPYCFCCDLIDMYCDEISKMESYKRLKYTEELIIALMKTIKQSSVNSSLHPSLINQFNQIMLIYTKDYLPEDIKKVNFETDQHKLIKYHGYRVRSIFKTFVNVLKYTNTPDTCKVNSVYKFKSLHTSKQQTENVLFKQLTENISYKCMDLCDFSIDDWLVWYEIEVVEDDTNLQSAIGHLCYELCCFIDNGTVTEKCIKEFRPILTNMAIEKIDFTNIDTTNVEVMIEHIEKSSRSQINYWIKKLIENSDIFINPNAITSLNNSVESMDYNCFKRIVDCSMIYYKNGGVVLEIMGDMLYNGIKNLDISDKLSILRHVIIHYGDNTLYFSKNFDEMLHIIVCTKYEDYEDQNELISKLIWLVIQQPKKLLHILVSNYITGIFGLPPTKLTSKKNHLYDILMEIHRHIDISFIYDEYSAWFDFNLNLSQCQKDTLCHWIYEHICTLNRIKPKDFLANILVPLINPSPNYEHLLFLVNLIRSFINEAQLVPEMHLLDTLLIRLAKILDNSRWTIDNYLPVRVKLCEEIIVTVQPLLHYASYIAKQRELDNIKKELSDLHLMTQSHFHSLLSNHYITIDGMNEQFIMTVQSRFHISYSNLNSTSSQRAQEEFVFSIATIMPRLTLNELNSFVTNYLNSAKTIEIIEASYFFLNCVMNAFMRIIVYLKTTKTNESSWDYLENAIVNFLDTLNNSKLSKVYDRDINIDLAINGVSKIIMVTKQLENSRQQPLLIAIRRICEVLILKPELNNEFISKLLSLISSVKTTNCKETMKNVVDTLLYKLTN